MQDGDLRGISVMTLVTLALLFIGVCVTGAFLRLHKISWPGAALPWFPEQIRDYGLWLALVPLVWAIASIRASLRSDGWSDALWWLGLFILVGICVMGIASSLVAFFAATHGPTH